MKLLIIGAGGHGKVVGEIAKACGYEIDYLDDTPGVGVIGTTSDIEKYISAYDGFIVGIGNNETRRKKMEQIEQLGGTLVSLIHPSAYVSDSVKVGSGTVIEPMALVNTNSSIGKGCILSVGCIVDHDVVIEDYVHVNAGAICKGGAHFIEATKIEAGEVVHGYN